MPSTDTLPVCVFSGSLRFRQLMILGLLIFATAGFGRGQATPTPKPGPSVKQTHWQKYATRKYSFSFQYPDAYKSVPFAHRNDDPGSFLSSTKELLLLQRRDNPDAKIWVRIDLRRFDLQTLARQNDRTGSDPSSGPLQEPEGHPIGHHIFYFFGGGDAGCCARPDLYFVKVDGKTLEFLFDGPYDVPDSNGTNEETQQLESEILKTFRTF